MLPSYSEGAAYDTCRRRYYYAHILKLAPKSFSPGLSTGIAGHELLEEAHKAIIGGANPKAAVLKKYSSDISNYSSSIDLVLGYLDYYEEHLELHEIITVEHVFQTDTGFPFKVDLIERNKKTKEVTLVDWKFLYNRYADKYIPILGQLQLYTAALESLGYKVNRALYRVISTRKNSKTPYTEIPVPFEKISQHRTTIEHEDLAEEIANFKALDPIEQDRKARRNPSALTCNHCPFTDICATDLYKRPGRELLLKTFYKENTYGYEYLEES